MKKITKNPVDGVRFTALKNLWRNEVLWVSIATIVAVALIVYGILAAER